jgi:hypothetical protein
LAGYAAAADFELAYDTGLWLDGPVVEVGVPTWLNIAVVNNTGTEFPIGGIVFDFEAPEGGLAWDLDGPDGNAFGGDDGFEWEPWLGGSCHCDPFYFMIYYATIDPPQTALNMTSDVFAFTVPANDGIPVARLEITAVRAGTFTLRVGEASDLLFRGVSGGFAPVADLGGTEAVTFTSVPEPGVLACLCAAGVLLPGCRRRYRPRASLAACAGA